MLLNATMPCPISATFSLQSFSLKSRQTLRTGGRASRAFVRHLMESSIITPRPVHCARHWRNLSKCMSKEFSQLRRRSGTGFATNGIMGSITVKNSLYLAMLVQQLVRRFWSPMPIVLRESDGNSAFGAGYLAKGSLAIETPS